MSLSAGKLGSEKMKDKIKRIRGMELFNLVHQEEILGIRRAFANKEDEKKLMASHIPF